MTDPTYNLPFYPSISDPDIRFSNLKKLEYQEIAARHDINVENTPVYREPMTQYIGPSTPYDRLLIIHSVGTGKTACAIGIAERYKKFYKQAIILNKSDLPTENFKSLLDKHFNEIQLPVNEIFREKAFYKFDTYSKFAKKVLNTSEEILKETYERTIFIIDEVHNIVTKTHDEDDKNYSILTSLFDILENCVVVGMTATPMRDSYEEIVPLANMFIKVKKNHIPKSFKSIDDITDKLKLFASTTVSWYQQQPSFKVTEIGETPFELSKNTVLCQAGQHQINAYRNECKRITDNIKNTENGTEGIGFMDKGLIYASLAAFPKFGTNTTELIIEQTNYNNICNNYVFNDNHKDIIDQIRMNPASISCKFAYTMAQIEQDDRFLQSHDKPWELKPETETFKGLIYIFCEDIASTGIKTLMAMLQLFGYEYYTGEDNVPSNDRRFTIYTGDNSICPNGSQRLDKFRHDNNELGKICKIIIASNVMKESVSLRAIRKVFIWTSHWNYSAIIQAQGRAIRRDAFLTTSESIKKDVKIYRLSTIVNMDEFYDLDPKHKDFNKQLRELSIDIYKYYKSTQKMVNIEKVENIFKEYALDSHFVNTGHTNDVKVEDFSTCAVENGFPYKEFQKRIIKFFEVVNIIYVSDLRYSFTDSMVDSIENVDDQWMSVAMQYLDLLMQKPLIINGQVKYLKMKNNLIFLVENPLDNELPLKINNKLKYKNEKLLQYIDIRQNMPNNFRWDMNLEEFVANIKSFTKYRIDIIETIVRAYYGKIETNSNKSDIQNLMRYLQFYLYKINDKYYHISEKNHISNAKYSNNSSSINDTTILRKYNEEDDKWEKIDQIEFNDISFRIKYIKLFKILKLIIKRGIHASYSLHDGELRIHNYDTFGQKLNNPDHIKTCNKWIKFLTETERIGYNEKEELKLDDINIRKQIIRTKENNNKYNESINMSDLRTNKRGLNVESHSMDKLIIIILKIFLYCVPKETKNKFFNIGEDFSDINVDQDTKSKLEILVEDNQHIKNNIYATYLTEKNRFKGAPELKEYVKECILLCNLYIVN